MLRPYVLGILVFMGIAFGAYKFSQRQVQPPREEKVVEGKVFCQEPRPEVCTLECITNPPYICGSEGKSYCTTCQACSNPNVEWYIIQDRPCS